MKGFNEVTIYNRPFTIVYKGEHYAIRHSSGRTTRMTKADIIKKFHLHRNALDRYIGCGFKNPHCNANEDVVRVKRCKADVESAAFIATSAVVIACGVALILAVIFGYIDKNTLRPYAVPMAYAAFTAMFMSVEIVEYLADKFDFVLGIEREG